MKNRTKLYISVKLLAALFCFLTIPFFGISAENQGTEADPDLEQRQESDIEEAYPYTIEDISRRIEIREHETHILGGAEIGYPPYSIVNNDDQADGFSVELMRAALEIMGYRLSYITGPWAEMKKKFEVGEVEALPLVGRTPEREGMYDFTFPYLTMHGAVVVHEDDTKTRSLDDVKDKRIAVLKGDNAEEYVRRKDIGEEIVPTKTFADALLLLYEKKVDAVVIQRFLALQLMDEFKIDNLRITGQPIMDFKQSFCFAVQEGNKDLLEILNEGLSLIIANGTYDELYTKWFGPLQSLSRDYERIIVGGDNAYPPYEFLNDNGEPDGFNSDITRAIAEEIGLQVEIVLKPWEGAMDSLRNRETDILQGIFYSPARDREFSFSQPHTVVSYVAVTRKGELKNISSMRDLEGYSLLVQKDDIMHERAVDFGYEESITSMENSEKTLEALNEGIGDCALVPRIQAAYWIDMHGWDNLKVGSNPLLSHDYCFGTLEGNELLLKEFSEGLAALEASGEYREIYNRWFGVYEQQEQSLLDTLKTISYFIIPLLILIVLIIIWSWSLRKKVFKRTEQLQLAMDNLRSQVRQKEAAEKTLRESEAKFREYIVNAPNGIFVTDENGMNIEVNDAAAVMTGFEKEELLQMHVYELMYGDAEDSQEGQESREDRESREDQADQESLSRKREQKNRKKGRMCSLCSMHMEK